MRREQIIISIIAVFAIIGLYQLPKVVVDNDENIGLGQVEDQPDNELHEIEFPDSVVNRLKQIRDNLITSNSRRKSSIIADSLAKTFLIYNQLDSATEYAEFILRLDTTGLVELAGDIYYKAFGLVSDGLRAEKYGSRVKEIYNQVIAEQQRPDLEARVAMTYVTGDNPMEGILRLRQLVEDNPDNVEAQYNLGLLSIQSGQFDRAVERFTKVTELDPANLEGYFYLGVSYLELGNESKAKENFSYVAKEGNDPAIIKLVEDYLKKIN